MWMRGGTSKCWIFDADCLVGAELPVDTVLEAAFGAADAHQLDGVGGGTSTTSKAMLVRRSRMPGVDVDYTFAQVGIGQRVVEWGSNCGNCATAVGLYAVQHGLVPPDGEQTTVRMLNTNTGSRLDAVVATPGGRVPHTGTQTVPGVEGTGVPVGLRFLAPLSGSDRPTLPAGEPASTITADEHTARMSIIDAGAVCALLDAASLALRGDESVHEMWGLLDLLIAFRRQASVAAGLSRSPAEAADAVPKVGVVAAPSDYLTSTGQPVGATEYDISARMLSMRQPHPAIGLTSAVAVAVAAVTPGTTAHDVARGCDGDVVRIGTPSGVVSAELERDAYGSISAVVLWRAARRLASARLEIPDPVLEPSRSDAEAHAGVGGH